MLDKEGYKEFTDGQREIYEKIARPLPYFPLGIMIVAGISLNWVGKLIFVVGTMNSFHIDKLWKCLKKI